MQDITETQEWKDYKAKNAAPPTPEATEYNERLNAANVRPSGRPDPFVTALKGHFDEHQFANVHESAFDEAEIAVDETPAPAEFEGSAELEDAIGVAPGSLAAAGYTSAEDVLRDFRALPAVERPQVEPLFANENEAKQVMAELRRRTFAEIDKWNSEVYGTSKSRTIEQFQEAEHLFKRTIEHVGDMYAVGATPASIEKMARRARIMVDQTYQPHKTPRKEGFRSIHHALIANPT